MLEANKNALNSKIRHIYSDIVSRSILVLSCVFYYYCFKRTSSLLNFYETLINLLLTSIKTDRNLSHSINVSFKMIFITYQWFLEEMKTIFFY